MAASTPVKIPSIKTLDDYYKLVMDEYAETGEGILHRLIPSCPGGDFTYASYKWTPPQRLAWKLDRKAPCDHDELPHDELLLLQSVHFPAERDRVRDTAGPESGAKKTVIDIRISKEQFSRLEEVIGTPGLRVWLRDDEPPAFLQIPSHIFIFTEEERTKYRENKYGEDGSDLPTINTLVRRFESSGAGKIHGVGSVDSAADSMNIIVAHLREQESKK